MDGVRCAIVLMLWAATSGRLQALVDDNFLLIAKREEGISQLDLTTLTLYPLNFTTYCYDVTYDPLTREVYWSDWTINAINTAPLHGSNFTVILEGVSVYGITVDGRERQLYFIDYDTNSINVVAIDGGEPRQLLSQNAYYRFTDITIDTDARLLYSTRGSYDRLEKSHLDGSNRQTVASGAMLYLAALDIDENGVCWSDSGAYSMECADLDGGNRRVVWKGTMQVRSLQLTSTHILFTATDQIELYKFDRQTGELEVAVAALGSRPLRIHRYASGDPETTEASTEMTTQEEFTETSETDSETTGALTVMTTPASTETSQTVNVEDMRPIVGILAGGTRITLTGHGFPSERVTLGFGTYSATSTEPCSPSQCSVLTPPGRLDDLVVKQGPVTVAFPGRQRVSLPGVTFTYFANPRVNSISPLKTLVAGGTILTVAGEGFDAVGDPELLIHVRHVSIQGGQSSTTSKNNTTFASSCAKNSTNVLRCPTPKLDLPFSFHGYEPNKEVNDSGDEDTENSIDNDAVESVDNDSKESTSPGFHIHWDIPGQSLDFVLGIRLDGDETYTDLSHSLPDFSQIKVFAKEPEFDRFSGTEEIQEGELLRITGRRLDDGMTSADYTVMVGKAICNLMNLNNNELTCVVPREAMRGADGKHSVLVRPGLNLGPYDIGSVKYKTEIPLLYVIIGATVGCGLALLIVAGIVVVICRNRSRDQPNL